MKIRQFYHTEAVPTSKFTVFDIETDGLKPTLIHCLAASSGGAPAKATSDPLSILKWVKGKGKVLIGHNILSYDIPALEKLVGVELEHEMIDTLYLSWYLYPNRLTHGLDGWGEELGVEKPKVTDWEGLPPEEYRNRCRQDVEINTLLWEKQWKDLNKLYDTPEEAMRLVRYLTFKGMVVANQEKSKWKLNVKDAEAFLLKVQPIYDKDIAVLNSCMPKVPKLKVQKPPKALYKKAGGLSVAGAKWLDLLKELGLPEDHKTPVEFINSYDEPNAGSHKQVKEWLLGMGWKPDVFKYTGFGDDKRAIPQLRQKDEDGMASLVPSVMKLMKDNPELKHLEQVGVDKHRLGIVEGFLKNVDEDGFLQATIGGLTNTLRLKHRVIVNLPGVGKTWGKDIRGMLEARDGHILLGSDQSALEDVTKNHYIYPYDPEYVREQGEKGYCPHVDIANLAGFLDDAQVSRHKSGDFLNAEDKANIKSQRAKAKPVNYGSLYGIQAAGLADATGMLKITCEKLLKVYWQRNKAVLELTEDLITKNVNGQLWLYQPVSKLWYTLRKEKDRFSTLNQGTGTFAFDLWVYHILKRRPQITGQFHDEVILEIKDTPEEIAKAEKILLDALDDTNNELRLNKDLGVDIQFNKTYAGIH